MGRKPKCKSCVSYEPQEDGTVLCEYNGRLIDPNGSPMFDGGACYEKKKKKKLTRAELSLIRSKAGRMGGLKSSGGGGPIQTKTMNVRLHDHKVFAGYSQMNNRSLSEQFHVIMKQVLMKHPELKPDGWID